MAVEERRRIALHRAAAASWGEEVADTLVELVAPSGHELATRADIRGILDAMAAMDERWDERVATGEAGSTERFLAFERQLQTMDRAWQDRLTAAEARAEASEHRVIAHHERSLQEAMTRQTRVVVVALTTTVVAMSGLSLTLVSMLVD